MSARHPFLWTFTLTFLSICSLYLLFCVSWFAFATWKLRKYQREHKLPVLHAFYVYLSITSLTFAFGTTASDLWHATSAYIRGLHIYDLSLVHITATADAFYVSAMTTVYLFMIGRVYLTFKSSFFQLSKPLTAFFVLLILANFAIWAAYIILLITTTDFSSAVRSIRDLEIALLIVDFVLNIGLLLMFITKLHELLVSGAVQRSLGTPLMGASSPTNTSKEDIRLDDDQEKFIHIISKHTLLCCWAILLNLTFYLTNLYMDFITTYDPSPHMYLLMYCGRSFGTLVNAMVVFFNFKFTLIYYRCFCYCCHVGLNAAFRNWTKRTIYRRVSTKRPSAFAL